MTYKDRRTFAIISHPDAGKTTLTEKLLLFGGAIQLAGTVKGRKSSRHATSDWMELEKQRGISVTTSVMQFIYEGRVVNLLDTPGHEDFSEDTYRTLTAVDSALMVIDAAKGVEERTLKLFEVCRLRQTPIITFINKLDRYSKSPIELLDEIERTLNIKCAPITWPMGMGKEFKGVFYLEDEEHKFSPDKWQQEELDLVRAASHKFDHAEYLKGNLTPVFFGSAMNDKGVKELLDNFVKLAPEPLPRETTTRIVEPNEENFTGFVFKIQANMDPQHRDRIAFLRICSGKYQKNIKLQHVRLGREIQINNALTFMAGDRERADEAFPGDIIGLHNHGTIQIGDTFTKGENLKFTGIPHFAPELFRRVRLKDPLKSKALLKGLMQLSEEGATQLFRPLNSNDLILGAVGILQFDVVAHRLQFEYNVDCGYDIINVHAARWVDCEDKKMLADFKEKLSDNLALDINDDLTYLAPTRVNLNLTMERWPKIVFQTTREH